MTNVTIPEEYVGYDYGFSGVDEPPQTKPTTEQPAPATDEIAALHSKLDDILAHMRSTSEISTGTETEAREKIRSLEAIIIPLLNNLLKTADKEYIYWPNRREVVERQIAAVLKITRG